jgi:hemerythrin
MLSVGIPALDSDHRCLVRVISLLHGVEEAGEAQSMIAITLDTLAIYAGFHFRREERVMAYLNFPGLEVHRGEHRRFLDHIKNIKMELGRRANLDKARHLLAELSAWLNHHILIQDKAYVPYVDDRERLELVAREGTAVCLLELTCTSLARPTRRETKERLVEEPRHLRSAAPAT